MVCFYVLGNKTLSIKGGNNQQCVGGVEASINHQNVLEGVFIGACAGIISGGILGGTGGSFLGCVAAGAAYGVVTSNGNIGLGALYGAIGGAVTGGLGFAGVGNDPFGIAVKIAAAGVTSGVMAELSGAKFSQGAIPAMIVAGVFSAIEAIDKSNAYKGTANGTETNQEQSMYSLDVDLTLKPYNPATDSTNTGNLFLDSSNEWTADMIKALKFSGCGVKEISKFTFKVVGIHAGLNVLSLGIEAIGFGTAVEMAYTCAKLTYVADHTLNSG